MSQIGVGIIGASPGASWAAVSHVPAIRSVPDFELVAVSTSRIESASAASEAFGVTAYSDATKLIADPRVELVVVAVKVPEHRALIEQALDAGKMVYSEWPLGTGLGKARALAEKADALGTRTVVGLQARYSPVIEQVRALVAGGVIGEVLGSTLEGSSFSWGAETSASATYLFDAANGVTPLSVVGMHALEGVTWALGDIESVGAAQVVRRGEVLVVETGGSIPVTTPDQFAVSARLKSGVVLAAFFRGGTSRAGNLR